MHNPYRPTEVPLKPASKEFSRFPYALVARWVIGALLVGHGTLRLVFVTKNWHWLADRAIVDAGFNPFVQALLNVCEVLTGVLLILRSKWMFAPLLGHCAMFLWVIFGFGTVYILISTLAVWSAQLVVLCFGLWLFAQRRLR